MGRFAFPVCILFAVVLSCSTDPSDPDFLITSVEFTGDSTAAGAEPYLEFTLQWEAPSPETRFQYTVYRSDSPGIQDDPSEASELVTLQGRTWADSDSLEWGSVFYYAIMAESSSGSSRWSNEVSAVTPVSPFPAPVQLSFERQLFFLCDLEWSQYEGGEDFRWYVLYRSNHPGIAQNPSYQNDTAFVTDDMGMVSFRDSLVLSKHYALAVVDSSGLRSFSNEVCFEPGADFPWRFYYNFDFGCHPFSNNDFAFISGWGERMYLLYSCDYSGDNYLQCRSTYSGSYVDGIARDDIYSAAERPDGTILVCFGEDGRQMSQLSVFTGDLASELHTVPLDRMVTLMIETDAGVLCSSGGKALVLDPFSLQTVDSIPYSFTSAVLEEELDRVFLCRNSYVVSLRSSDLAHMGNIMGNAQHLVYSHGVLYCIGETEIRGYDPISLTLQSSCQLPENTLCSTVHSSGEYLVVYVFRDDPCRVEVFDYATGEFLGLISDMPSISEEHCFLSAPQGDFLWFMHWSLGNMALHGNKIII